MAPLRWRLYGTMISDDGRSEATIALTTDGFVEIETRCTADAAPRFTPTEALALVEAITVAAKLGGATQAWITDGDGQR